MPCKWFRPLENAAKNFRPITSVLAARKNAPTTLNQHQYDPGDAESLDRLMSGEALVEAA